MTRDRSRRKRSSWPPWDGQVVKRSPELQAMGAKPAVPSRLNTLETNARSFRLGS